MDESGTAVDTKPDRFQQRLFVTSLVVLFGSSLLWFVGFGARFKAVYESLGMKHLPLPTDLALTVAAHAPVVFISLALVLLLVGVIVLRRNDRKAMNRWTAINFIVSALLPGYIYLSVHMPIVELQRKLNGG